MSILLWGLSRVQVRFRLVLRLPECYACGMRTQFLFATSLLILLAWAIRLYHIEAQSIWFDEGWSAYAAVQPTLWDAVEADPTNPPLYYLILNITTRFFGDSEFGLRVTSALIGLLTIPLAGQLGRRLFNNRAGLFAMLLAACSPPLWWASQEARMYTLLAVLVLVAALAWHQLITKPNRAAWLALLAAETLLLYAHNTGPVIVLWLNIVTVFSWIAHLSLHRPDWRLWLPGQVLVGVLWLPWFITRFINVQAANSAITTGPQISPEFFSRLWQSFWTAPWEMVGKEPVAVAFASAAVLALLLIPFRQVNARWLIIHVLLLIGGLLTGLSLIGNEMHGRYLVMVVPLLLVVLGAGLARLRWPVLGYIVAGGFVALLLVNVRLAQNRLYQHDDVRSMVRYYADTLTADDTVLAWSYADRYDLAYYWERLGVEAQRVTLPEGADWEQVAPLLPESGRVALNKWYTQRADYRDMLPCVLGQGTVNAPLEYTTYGMTTFLYESPPPGLPGMRSEEYPILQNGVPIVHVTTAGAYPLMTAERALCVPVQLRLNQPLSVDLRAAVIIRNALGWDVAQASGVFATPNQRTTSAAAPGELLSAYVLLRLPYGAPPGDYEVLLRVFDEVVAPSGYDVVNEAGQITGNDLRLGIWPVEPGADWSKVRRETHLPYRMDSSASGEPVLLAHNVAPEGTVQPGQRLKIELLWRRGTERLPALVFTGQSWGMGVQPEPGPRDTITLDWRQVIIPGNASNGPMQIALGDGTVLATYMVDALARIDEAPEVDVEVNRVLGEVGTLVGYIAENEADLTQSFPITLIWQAGETQTSYTVFAQLLDSQGRLIAQSDSIPAQGERPTTGWRAGEYIIDMHKLQFNEVAAPGEAQLIVGMYDAQTGQRIRLEPDGPDFIEVPGSISVR